MSLTVQQLSRWIDAAQGRIKCDLILKNATFLDVFSCTWKKGELAILDGVFVGFEPGLQASQIYNAQNRWIVPGWIDAHVHIESSMMTPENFEQAVLRRGTTTAICDPHELANVSGKEGIAYFLEAASELNLNLQVMLSSCVPSTQMETNGSGEISSKDLALLQNHPHALGLAEMMNVPGVLQSDPEVLKKLVQFSARPIDGHCPCVSGKKLAAYTLSGISSCHESSELSEASEKLSQGMAIWIREGSVAKDLKRLMPLLRLETTGSIGFCTDDRNALDILTEGHIDHLVRTSLLAGIPAEWVFRSASWTPAQHYGLHRGFRRIGALAPGYTADCVVLNDLSTCEIAEVFKSGQSASNLETPSLKDQAKCFENSVHIAIPEVQDLQGPQGLVHTIGVLEGKILTEHRIRKSQDPGIAHLSVLERHGHGFPPSNGYVEGFGLELNGAIASSVGHDSHNLIAVGSNPSDMRVAFSCLAKMGGGFCVVQKGVVLAELALPIGGLMSHQASSALAHCLRRLKVASLQIRCVLREPFLQLAFLSLPVIPSLKLTDRGLVDVEKFQFINVQA